MTTYRTFTIPRTRQGIEGSADSFALSVRVRVDRTDWVITRSPDLHEPFCDAIIDRKVDWRNDISRVLAVGYHEGGTITAEYREEYFDETSILVLTRAIGLALMTELEIIEGIRHNDR